IVGDFMPESSLDVFKKLRLIATGIQNRMLEQRNLIRQHATPAATSLSEGYTFVQSQQLVRMNQLHLGHLLRGGLVGHNNGNIIEPLKVLLRQLVHSFSNKSVKLLV